MKRGWIGAGMLAALLVIGILAGNAMERRHSPSSAALAEAAKWAMAGDWEKAEALTGSVRAEWERAGCLSAALMDHEPLEQIEGMFAQLRVYAASRDAVAYGAVCAQLSAALDAIGEANTFNVRNLL
ncbi:MAG: DUF4363 family protein [Oscillospiraceae bacterium]|nr:DUF4363 family protein [Oscillospiraceae bacterium]